MNANPLDEVIDFLQQAHDAAMDIGDHTSHRMGVTFTSDVVFMLTNLLETHRNLEQRHRYRMRVVSLTAFALGVVSFALSLWNMVQ